ncbi:unnamed protein product [Didymodactylos carnosus]|uniref:Uncharacterized protein n=1 Tax=Didymodactylos carnosus TaxID=1234261 RepID=A0A814UES9_9BILA|nr:unnamed protein product [Didymodactylos carnosus]CAF1174275.1 unnamed protein product [Didymodactylos carnosus]CAF3695725.1 unnamed protein product [Didymodactylos carnosus]CAF3938159.1 unnamed protein product [Didymodactylos carnosus]
MRTCEDEQDWKLLADIRQEIHTILKTKAEANVRCMPERCAKHLRLTVQKQLLNQESNRSLIPFLIHPTKGKVSDIESMHEVAEAFYQDLYSEKMIDSGSWNTLFNGLPVLSDADALQLERNITATECHAALLEMELGKSPDYKIISKVLAQRLKLVMEKVVHPDQTCSVPNRTLQDNIHLARSIIKYHRQRREAFGLVQWDQGKAFDRKPPLESTSMASCQSQFDSCLA